MKAGWVLREIGDAFQTVTGNTPPKSSKHYYGHDVPLVKPPELIDGNLHSASDGLSERGAQVARVAPQGSVLVSCIGNLGKIGLATRPVAFNQQINAIYPDPTLAVPRFTFYQALSPQFKEQLDALAAGTTVSIVNKSRFNSIKVPLPPLEEQQRIVAVLDEAFEGLTRAREHAEANLRNARELFESYRELYLDPIDRPDWRHVLLEELVEIKHGFAFKSAHFSDQGKYAVLTPGNYFENGGFRDRGEKQRYYTGDFPTEFILRRGDLLVAMTEQAPGLLGSCLIVPDDDHYLHNQRLGLITPRENVAWSAEYFAQAFNLRSFRKGLSDTCSGATVRHTSPKRILAERIPYSDCQTQMTNAATHLSGLQKECDTLANVYEGKLNELADLRQSLLQRAFAGELT